MVPRPLTTTVAELEKHPPGDGEGGDGGGGGAGAGAGVGGHTCGHWRQRREQKEKMQM